MSSTNKDEPLKLKANVNGKIQVIDIPDYSLRYPSYNTVSLSTVKHSIDQPRFDQIYGYEPIEAGNPNNISYPIQLVGNLNKLNQMYGLEVDTDEKKEKTQSCTSGRENTATTNKQRKEQFRFNRVRMVPNDWPEHGRRECYFDTKPGLDKFGAKVESSKTFNHRSNQGSIYSNFSQADSFKPYGYPN